MTKKEHAEVMAVRLLHNVYKDDMYNVASIVNADCEFKERGDTTHIIKYLKDTREFIDQLIKDMEE